MKKLTVLLLVLSLFASLSMGLLLPAQTVQAEEEENLLRWGLLSAPSGNFNPLLLTDSFNSFVSRTMHESLVTMDPDGEYIPALATEWEISEDQKSVTFKLREDVKWHDGEDFNADDVKFTFDFVADKDFPGVVSSQVMPILGYDAYHDGEADSFEGVEVIDEYTVKITTTEIYAPFLLNIGGLYILPEHYWSTIDIKNANEETEMIRNPIGTGPFKMGEFVPDQYASVLKNENYWDGEVQLDRIIFQVVNNDTVSSMLVNDELDFAFFFSNNPDDIALYKEHGKTFVELPETGHQMMVVNNQNPILNDKYVRQGFTYAIDRAGIVEHLVHGFGRVGNQIYPTNFWCYPGDDALNHYEYSPEKAIEVLTEKAGWEYKDETMYIEGEPAKFTLIYPSGNKARELSAPVVQQNFKAIGIELDIQMMEFKTMLAQISEDKEDAFELCLLGVGLSYDGDPKRLLATDMIFDGWNFARYSNPEMDALIEEGLGTLDRDERKAIYHDLAVLCNEEMPNIYFYNWSSGAVMSEKLSGFVQNPYNLRYSIKDWTMR